MAINREHILFHLHYFEKLSREQPEHTHWARGFNVAKKWLKLFDNDSVTQEDIDSVMRELRTGDFFSTGWNELTRLFWLWAKDDKGYKVPVLQDILKDQFWVSAKDDKGYKNPVVQERFQELFKNLFKD